MTDLVSRIGGIDCRISERKQQPVEAVQKGDWCFTRLIASSDLKNCKFLCYCRLASVTY